MLERINQLCAADIAMGKTLVAINEERRSRTHLGSIASHRSWSSPHLGGYTCRPNGAKLCSVSAGAAAKHSRSGQWRHRHFEHHSPQARNRLWLHLKVWCSGHGWPYSVAQFAEKLSLEVPKPIWQVANTRVTATCLCCVSAHG